jgi:restriction endonuclease S subunit
MAFATRGVSQANVNASSLQEVVVPLPPLALNALLLT